MTAGDQVWGIFNAEIEREAQSEQGHWVARHCWPGHWGYGRLDDAYIYLVVRNGMNTDPFIFSFSVCLIRCKLTLLLDEKFLVHDKEGHVTFCSLYFYYGLPSTIRRWSPAVHSRISLSVCVCARTWVSLWYYAIFIRRSKPKNASVLCARTISILL